MSEECNSEEYNKRKSLVESLQRRFFGERFVNANFSKIQIDNGLSERVAGFLKDPAKFLVVLGPPGTGKTYMCSAFLDFMPSKCRTFRAYSERQLFERIRQGISSGQGGDYLAHLHDLIDDDFIIIDDLGSSGHNAWREEIIMEALDYRYKDCRKTLITSNLSELDFRQIYGERISSRLFASENIIISLFGMPDLRQKGL